MSLSMLSRCWFIKFLSKSDAAYKPRFRRRKSLVEPNLLSSPTGRFPFEIENPALKRWAITSTQRFRGNIFRDMKIAQRFNAGLIVLYPRRVLAGDERNVLMLVQRRFRYAERKMC